MVAIISLLSESLNGSWIGASVVDDEMIAMNFCRELVAAAPAEW